MLSDSGNDKAETVRENLGVILLTPWLTGFTFLNTRKLLPFSFLESLFVLTNHKLIRTRVMALGLERFDRQGQDAGGPPYL